MAPTDADATTRTPLTRDRILHAAIEVADEGGIEAITMRGVASSLGVEAMSLYHHVANKEAMLDGMIEVVVGEIHTEAGEVPELESPDDWLPVLRGRILAARAVLLRHKWVPEVLETRTDLTPGLIAWFDQVIGVMTAGGMSYDLVHHAMHALGSRALGFVQELFSEDGDAEDEFDEMMEQMASFFPNMAGMMAAIAHTDGDDQTLGWCDDQTEFEFGLDLLLEGLHGRRDAL